MLTNARHSACFGGEEPLVTPMELATIPARGREWWREMPNDGHGLVEGYLLPRFSSDHAEWRASWA